MMATLWSARSEAKIESHRTLREGFRVPAARCSSERRSVAWVVPVPFIRQAPGLGPDRAKRSFLNAAPSSSIEALTDFLSPDLADKRSTLRQPDGGLSRSSTQARRGSARRPPECAGEVAPLPLAPRPPRSRDRRRAVGRASPPRAPRGHEGNRASISVLGGSPGSLATYERISVAVLDADGGRNVLSPVQPSALP